MSLVLGKSQGNKAQVPDIKNGQYPARLVQIVDIGIQEQIDWQTKEAKDPKPRVLLTFELPTQRVETDEGNKPRWMSKEFTLSGHEQAALPKVIANINPIFDIEKESLSSLLEMQCMVAIGHTVTGNPKIVGINPIIEGFEVPELENDTTAFDFSDPDLEVFKALPKWIQKKVMEALNYEGSDLSIMIDADGYSLES